MIEIHDLTSLDGEAFLRIALGYSSPAKYVVAKAETHERTSIELTLVSLPTPYVKRWEWTDEEVRRYDQVVDQGFSLGASEDGTLVGIAIAERLGWNRSLWVWEFHVVQSHQRRGIGSRLMEALAAKARRAGLRVMVFETQNTNVPAISFYRSVGCELDGVDLSYYTNTDADDGEVAVFMKRKLAP